MYVQQCPSSVRWYYYTQYDYYYYDVCRNKRNGEERETSSYVVIMTNGSFTYIYNDNIVIIIPSVHCYQNILYVMYVCWPPPACDNLSEPPDLPVIIFNEVIHGMWLNLKRVVRARYDCQGWLTQVIVTAMRARGGRLRRTGYAYIYI